MSMERVSALDPGAPAPRDARAIDVPLYAARTHIYQREVQGPWQRRRTALLLVLAGVYVVGPWLRWGDRQAILFDVPGRKFHLLGLTFWPQDFVYLSALLVLAALSLFFFTTVAGRLWCGYACPQTVWTRFFMWIEWLTEGDRAVRMRLDRGPWTTEKVARKLAKHGLWLVLAFVVGTTFVGYFLPIRAFVPRLVVGDLTGGEWIFFAIASLALYADAGFMREQICRYACPYARFQGAMFDPATLTIFYDETRGEPRGHRARGVDHRAAGLGDCVDCGLCVQVCPTGIDIRNGTQYECIGCAACIDACDAVMAEIGRPQGLVRYATLDGLAGRPTRFLRPRVVGYGLVLACVAAALGVALALRVPLAVDVLRDRARLFREVGDDIENVYTLKLMNKDQHAHAYRVAVEPPLELVDGGEVTLAAGEVRAVPVRVRAHRDVLDSGTVSVVFAVEATDAPAIRVRELGRFLGPAAGAG